MVEICGAAGGAAISSHVGVLAHDGLSTELHGSFMHYIRVLFGAARSS